MPQIILILLQIFGPIIADALKRWLEKKLNKAATLTHPRMTWETDADAARRLFDTAIENEGFFARLFGGARRLRKMRDMVAPEGTTTLVSVLPPLAAEELK